MPELPEVESMSRTLDRAFHGKRLDAVVLRDPKMLVKGDVATLEGGFVSGVRRRAKYAIVDVGTHSIALHFRMTGRLVDGDDRNARLVFMSAGHAISVVDPRRLAEARVGTRAEIDSWLESLQLGPEPYPDEIDPDALFARFDGCRQPIKVAMMEQDRLAGIGNIAASEILWEARIDPKRKPNALTKKQWETLSEAMHTWLHNAVDALESRPWRFISEGEDPDVAGFKVYKREGRGCPRCGSHFKIERIEQAARSTYFCAKCQRGLR
jgi:formamidopyrimidine-DNA glycosylase